MVTTTQPTGDLLDFVRRAGTGEAFSRTLAAICRFIGRELRAHRVTVYLLQDGRPVPVVSEYPSGARDEAVYRQWRAIDRAVLDRLAELVASGDEVHLVTDPRTIFPTAVAAAWDVHPFVTVRLDGDDGPLGILLVEGDPPTLDRAMGRAPAIGTFLALVIETARRTERELARARETEALLEVAEALRDADDLTTVLASVARTSARVAGFERASIFLLDDEGRLRPHMSQFADGHVDREAWVRFRTLELDLPAAITVIETGRPAVYEHPEEHPEAIPPEWREPFGIRSEVILPLAFREEPAGVLVLDHRAPRRIDPRTVRIAQAVATQGAVAIGLARLLEGERAARVEAERASAALAARAAQQAAVATLGQSALRASHLGALLDEAVALVAETLGTELAKVLELTPDGNRLLLRAGVGWRPGQVGTAVVAAGGASQAGYTLLSAEPVVVEDLASEARFHGPALLEDHGVVSGVSVLIGPEDRPYGVLGAHTTHRRTFSADDVNFLQAVANVLASAVERQRMEAALRRSRRRFESILATANDAIVSFDAERRVVLFNHGAEVVFGYRADEIIGRPVDLLFPAAGGDESAGRPASPAALDIEAAAGTRVQRPARRRGGEMFPAAVTVSRLSLDDETTYTAIVRDMTERLATQERLERLVRSKDELIASVSHELRTPLTGVLGFVELLRDPAREFDPEERQTMIEAAAAEAQDLANIVEDLLAAARADIGTLHVARVPVDLRAQVSQVLESRGWGERVVVTGTTATVIGDPARVRQILRNLLSNTDRYGGDHVAVRIGQDGPASVSVCDDGPGIPPEERDRVFEPYERSSTRPHLPGAMGLGLTVSRNLARLMRGDLTYRYVDGWSVFTLTLPPVGHGPMSEDEPA